MLIKHFFLSLCLLGIHNLCLAQLTYPYFQNFEDKSFINDKNIGLDVNGPKPLPRDEINVTYGYGYSWEIVDTSEKKDNVLKLTAHGNDHNKKANYPRSRSQVTFLIDNKDPIYISYQIYIPNDSEFIENHEKDAYHIIQQFQASLWNPNTNTPYNLYTFNENGDSIRIYDALGILTVNYSKDQEKTRELEFWSNSVDNIKKHALGEIDNKEFVRRRNRMKIEAGIVKGEWNEIIMKINFSENFDEGYYQFWINRNPVMLDSIGVQKYNEHLTSLHHNENDEPFKFQTGFILYTTDQKPKRIPSLLKLGHYRQNTMYAQSIYYDNVRLWNRFPVDYTEKIGQTKIIKEQCAHKVENDNLILYAYDDKEANEYTFRFKNTKNGKIKTFTSNGPAIDLRRSRLLKGKKTYEVDVKSMNDYSDKCIVKSLKSS